MLRGGVGPDHAYGRDEGEICAGCHGPGKDCSPDKVHNVADPYTPPYARAPRQ
jgi:hypothetical protein